MIPNWFSASFISLFWPFSQNNIVWPLYILKKKEAGSQPGLPRSAGSRVDLPGRPGFTGPISRAGFCLDLDRSHARVDLPDWSGFQNYALKCREPVTYIDVPLLCAETLFTWLEIKYIWWNLNYWLFSY
jgi:hypothetical protein